MFEWPLLILLFLWQNLSSLFLCLFKVFRCLASLLTFMNSSHSTIPMLNYITFIIGESSRTFGERFKEHQKAPYPIFDHYNTTSHKICIENFGTVGREDQNLMGTIKGALYIRVNDPSLNRNIGKYHLLHIWYEVLFNLRTQIKIIDQGKNICQLVITSASHNPTVVILSATWH